MSKNIKNDLAKAKKQIAKLKKERKEAEAKAELDKNIKAEQVSIAEKTNPDLRLKNVKNALTSLNVSFDPNSTIQFLEELLEEEVLKRDMANKLERAKEFDDNFNSLSQKEQKVLLKETGMSDYAISVFGATLFTTQPASDLPISDIIKNIPMRLIEQLVVKKMVDYPFQELIQNTELVRNGLKQIIYKDYRATDNKSGASDVEISDYNQGTDPRFSEVYHVNTHIHKGMDILMSVLNDITISVGLFSVIVNDIAMGIAKPFSVALYTRVVEFLDQTDSYDEVIEIDATQLKDDKEIAILQAKTIKSKLISLKTPSRKHLQKLPNGATKGLESQHKSTEMVAYVSKDFATNQKFDFLANVFNLLQVQYKFKNIEEIDFDLIADYLPKGYGPSKNLTGLDVIIVEPEFYETIMQYSASKISDTPKMKSVINRYDKIGTIRRKDKLAIAFKTKRT